MVVFLSGDEMKRKERKDNRLKKTKNSFKKNFKKGKKKEKNSFLLFPHFFTPTDTPL